MQDPATTTAAPWLWSSTPEQLESDRARDDREDDPRPLLPTLDAQP